MKTRILKQTVLTVALGLALPSCLLDNTDVTPNEPANTVTFVVNAPRTGSALGGATGQTRSGVSGSETGGNGHVTSGVPEGYRNYFADADTEIYGATFGGYPDAESETAAFEGAVKAMAANYEKGSKITAGASGAPATRAITEASGNEVEDNRVDNIVILLFDKDAPHDFVKHIDVPSTSITDVGAGTANPDRSRKQFTLKLPDCDYEAVFLANAADYVSSELAGFEGKTLAEVQDELVFSYSDGGWWSSVPTDTDYRPFPMSSKPVDFVVPSTRDYATYPVELARALAKINVSVDASLTPGPTSGTRAGGGKPSFELEEIYLCNYNTGGYLTPHTDWRKNVSVFDDAARELGLRTTGLYDCLNYTGNIDSDNNRCIDEIFVFEQSAPATDDEWEEAICLIIGADIKVENWSGDVRYFRVDLLKKGADGKKHHVNVLRNFRYDIDITGISGVGYETPEEAYGNPPEGLEFEIEATPVEDMNETVYNGSYQLAVDRSVVILGPEQGATAKMKVYTDYEGGWSTNGYVPAGITMTPYTQTNVPNTMAADEITLTANNAYIGNVVNRTQLQYFAGSLLKTVTVVRLPAAGNVTPNDNVTGYVGAFWKASQTGERLIRLNPGVTWNAYVMDSDADWVVLDGKTSLDTGIPAGTPAKSGNDSGFDAIHNVAGNGRWTGGTVAADDEDAYFRIGLTGRYTSTEAAPARYATVLVSYTNVTTGVESPSRLLYLRQGEDPDYLMRYQDAATNAGLSTRPNVVKFSPYNLTAEGFKGSGAETEQVPIGARNGEFTDYPSQAGAFFQWAHTNGVIAYNPVMPPSVIPGGYSVENTVTGYWDAVSDFYESCPPGYRRPGDGATDVSVGSTVTVAASETMQSLWLRPQINAGSNTDNSVYGYYADGWFDRRAIGTQSAYSPGANANTAVSTGNSAVAYAGRVFFNPETGASLFFPAAGGRQIAGYLYYPGTVGYYWTASATSTTQATFIMPTKAVANRVFTGAHTDGLSVRCVVDERLEFEPTKPTTGIHAAPGVLGVNARTGELTLAGSVKYKGTLVEQNSEFNGGEVSGDDVYVAFFKWGSLIGTSSVHSQNVFNTTDIVWAPTKKLTGGTQGFDFTSLVGSIGGQTGQGAWNKLPYGSASVWPATDVVAGLGDPCELIAEGGGGWKTPSATDDGSSAKKWNYEGGSPFGTIWVNRPEWSVDQNLPNGARRVVADTANGLPHDGAVAGDGVSEDWSMFLPGAGIRTSDGHTQNPDMGYYWSTAASINLYFSSDYINPGNSSPIGDAFPIRCVAVE